MGLHKDPLSTSSASGDIHQIIDRQSECGTLQVTKLSIILPVMVATIPLVTHWLLGQASLLEYVLLS